jgi:hypothetical protein
LTVLVDADNVSPARLQPVLDLIAPLARDTGTGVGANPGRSS